MDNGASWNRCRSGHGARRVVENRDAASACRCSATSTPVTGAAGRRGTPPGYPRRTRVRSRRARVARSHARDTQRTARGRGSLRSTRSHERSARAWRAASGRRWWMRRAKATVRRSRAMGRPNAAGSCVGRSLSTWQVERCQARAPGPGWVRVAGGTMGVQRRPGGRSALRCGARASGVGIRVRGWEATARPSERCRARPHLGTHPYPPSPLGRGWGCRGWATPRRGCRAGRGGPSPGPQPRRHAARPAAAPRSQRSREPVPAQRCRI